MSFKYYIDVPLSMHPKGGMLVTMDTSQKVVAILSDSETELPVFKLIQNKQQRTWTAENGKSITEEDILAITADLNCYLKD